MNNEVSQLSQKTFKTLSIISTFSKRINIERIDILNCTLKNVLLLTDILKGLKNPYSGLPTEDNSAPI